MCIRDRDIYPKHYKPEHFVKLGRKKIERLIKKIGIFRVKAKSIYLMSKQVLEKHNGKVPKTFEELENLPGAVSYTHLRAHETVLDLVCRLLLEKKTKFIFYERFA